LGCVNCIKIYVLFSLSSGDSYDQFKKRRIETFPEFKVEEKDSHINESSSLSDLSYIKPSFFTIPVIISIINSEVEGNWNEELRLEYSDSDSSLILNESGNIVPFNCMKRFIKRILLLHPDLLQNDLLKAIQHLLYYTLWNGNYLKGLGIMMDQVLFFIYFSIFFLFRF
jgi:hypothetical protein